MYKIWVKICSILNLNEELSLLIANTVIWNDNLLEHCTNHACSMCMHTHNDHLKVKNSICEKSNVCDFMDCEWAKKAFFETYSKQKHFWNALYLGLNIFPFNLKYFNSDCRIEFLFIAVLANRLSLHNSIFN